MIDHTQDFYDWIENQIKAAMEFCRPYLTDEDIAEVSEKTYHKEYAIALQSLCYGFVSNKVMIPLNASGIIDELIFKMGMKDEEDDDYWFWIKVKPFLTLIQMENKQEGKTSGSGFKY